MTKYKKSRANYPDGVLGIYDNGGRSADRYTVVYAPYDLDGTLWYTYTAMSAAPHHPQGVGMWGQTTHRITRDTAGKTINLEDLPEACQRVVAEDLASCRYCGGDFSDEGNCDYEVWAMREAHTTVCPSMGGGK